jgi:hypothetical protein
MKVDVPGYFAGPLPRRDIVAICGYLNRSRRPSVDSCATSRDIFLDKLADAARMQ